MHHVRLRASLALVAIALLSACDAAAVKARVPSLTDAQAEAVAAHYRRPIAVPNSLSDAQLDRLARCESGGNPRIVSKSGTYHGLFQFSVGTWNGVARRVAPQWVGVRPSEAPAEVQRAMARQLFADRGRAPWPHCGRRL